MWHPDKLEQNKSEDGFYLVDGEKVDKSKADAMIKDLNEAKEVLKRRRDSSSSCSASVSSSSSSSSSEDSEYDSDIGAKRKQSKKGRLAGSSAAAKHREPKARPPSLHSEPLPKPVLKLKKEENREKSTDQTTPSAVSANDAKVSGKSSSQSSHVQQSHRPVPDPASKALVAPAAFSSAQCDSASARHTAVSSKLTGSEKILKQPAAVVVASGSQAPPLIPAKTSNPIKEPDLQQRWREKQAAASQIKRELPPLPSFHTTSLPPLPELPALPSIASTKSKPAVVADAKPAPAKVAPPSPVYPCVHPSCRATLPYVSPRAVPPSLMSHLVSCHPPLCLTSHLQVRVRASISGVERV